MVCTRCRRAPRRPRQRWCHGCHAAHARSWRRRNVQKYRETQRQRYHEAKDTPPGRAKQAVMVARRAGRLIPAKKCENCGRSGRLHAHHDDYYKPLVVRWLCPRCRGVLHKEHGPVRWRAVG